ncbi:MAG: PHP domain-containing protein [Solobacterium sp.]|nr:PHP domain-containing protein [Solobacterium sp.]
MNGMIDLHMHSTISDGTDTPEQILFNVKKAGIQLFSVTDHDALAGSLIIPGLLKEDDPVFIPGVEISCRDEEGQYHILGYGYDPAGEAIRGLTEMTHARRMKKVRARLKYLASKHNIHFPEEEVKHLLSLPNPGKPHIANLMVKYGFAATKEEAINGVIDELKFPADWVHPQQAIHAILASDGIPVLAHPSYGSGDQLVLGEEMDHRLARLKDFGLQGVEVFYSGFTGKIRQELLAFAGQYHLYVTAGSDYHGTNKLVQLGDTGLDEADEFPEGLTEFLAVCRKYNERKPG